MRISDWSSDVCTSDLPAAGYAQGRYLFLSARFAFLGCLPHEPWAYCPAAVHDTCGHDCELQGGRREVALADAGNDRLALLPGTSKSRTLPRLGRHQPWARNRQPQIEGLAAPNAPGHRS